MKINTINTKILIIIASAFIIMTLSIYLFASHYLKSMIDGYQESVYSEKIDTILDMLERKYEHLTETFLIDAYQEDFKQSFLEDFRSSYFTGNDQKVYPFILDSKGKCMIDAGMNGKSCPPKEKSFFAEVKNEKKGSFEYAFKGSAYWVIKRHFPQWDWYIGYIVPLSVKYTHFYSFRDILAMIMAVTTVLALFIVSLLVTNFTKPIYQLTKASLALSSGNLDYPMKVNSSDETGILTQSFLSMRDAIRKTISDLNEKNTILTQEIAERKRIAHALKDSEQRYRLLVENQNDLVIKFDTSNRLLFVSPSFCNTFDGKEEDLLGKNLLELIHKDDRDRIQKTLDATHVPPYTCFHEERTLTKSGLRWFAWSAKGILSDDGTVTEVISVGRDVTSRKKAEEERELLIKNLEQKNAEMERFLYTVSHDLKSPLVTIEGFLNIVKKDLKKNDTSKLPSFISRMLNASVKMRELLDDLLNLSRIGRVVNEYEDVPFRDIVNDAMELLSASIEKKNIKITVEDNLPTVRGDRQRLTEVVMNLLENAIKFTSSEKNPVITVGTKKGEDGVIYFIKDNGIGIDPIYFEKIFGLFNKLDPNSEGTGVGLALIKRIIECHNGKIWVESNGQGKGCTFCFTIKA